MSKLYTKIISYTREFTMGPLGGLRVTCEFPTVADRVDDQTAQLRSITQFDPAADALTGHLYYVVSVDVRDIEPTEYPIFNSLATPDLESQIYERVALRLSEALKELP